MIIICFWNAESAARRSELKTEILPIKPIDKIGNVVYDTTIELEHDS